MRLLQRHFEVKTRYGGGFVQSIDGLARRARAAAARSTGSTTSTASRPTGRGRARAPRRRPRSGGTATTGAPRCASRRSSARSPSRSCRGAEGKRLPVRLECASGAAQRACDGGRGRGSTASGVDGRRPLAARHRRRAATLLRVLVGRGPTCARDPARAQLEHGPERSRRLRAPPPTGDRDRAARRARRAPCARSARAPGSSPRRAIRRQQPTWVVTGTDDAGRRRRGGRRSTRAR